jgi:hypothetical protein
VISSVSDAVADRRQGPDNPGALGTVFTVMMVKRCIAALAPIGGCVPGVAAPAAAAVLSAGPGWSAAPSARTVDHRSLSYGDITTAGALQVGLGAPQPRLASITAVNEITAAAAAQAVWALLADALRWPHRYAACRWVHNSAPAATCRRHLRLEGSPGQPARRGHRVGAAPSSDCSFSGTCW